MQPKDNFKMFKKRGKITEKFKIIVAFLQFQNDLKKNTLKSFKLFTKKLN